jgi:hypothetical protein
LSSSDSHRIQMQNLLASDPPDFRGARCRRPIPPFAPLWPGEAAAGGTLRLGDQPQFLEPGLDSPERAPPWRNGNWRIAARECGDQAVAFLLGGPRPAHVVMNCGRRP